jgi:hypothetical protein
MSKAVSSKPLKCPVPKSENKDESQQFQLSLSVRKLFGSD